MMKVRIVLKNGKVDEVFSSEMAAIHHKRQLIKKWAIAEIVERAVNDL